MAGLIHGYFAFSTQEAQRTERTFKSLLVSGEPEPEMPLQKVGNSSTQTVIKCPSCHRELQPEDYLCETCGKCQNCCQCSTETEPEHTLPG